MANFPSTQASALHGAMSVDEEVRRRSWDRLGRAYYPAVYKHLRVHWRMPPDDADDTAQGFFEKCLEGQVLERYEAQRARFRTYLRLCLDRFVQDERRARNAQRRGGRARTFDVDVLERELAAPADDNDPERAFEREWTRAVLAVARDALRSFTTDNGKTEHFHVFDRIESLDEPTHAQVAEELGIDGGTLEHRLAYARRHYRRLVLETLRDLTSSETEYREEARNLLGVDL